MKQFLLMAVFSWGCLAARAATPLASDLQEAAFAPLADSLIEASICAGGSYVFGAEVLTASGTYVQTFVASDGSDSTVTLVLTLTPAPVTESTVTLCAGATFIFGTDTLTTGGTYTDTLSTPDGCDSILLLHLEFVPFFQTDLAKSICAGDTLLFGKDTITLSGVYTDSLVAAGGCDSIVTLTLKVNPRPLTHLEAHICDGTQWLFGGDTLSVSGTYRDTLQALSGCDSIVVLDLEVAAFFETNLFATICAGETYSFGGADLTEGGVYTDSLSAAGGCDSTLVLTLTVLPASKTSISAEICSNDSYAIHGEELTLSGEYTFVFTAENGCDSIVHLSLLVNPVVETHLAATICSGASYEFNGQTLSDPGEYTITLTTAAGCDSTVILQLSMLDPIPLTELQASICAGQAFEYNGLTFTVADDYTVHLTAENGCDSTVLLHLEVLPTATTNLAATICAGGAYDFAGQTLTVAGTYTDTLVSANGCDSLVVLQLTVLPTFSTDLAATICANETYVFDGQELNQPGVFTAQLEAENGCDSTLNLTLTVLPVVETAIAATICSNEGYPFEGQLLTAPGIYTAVHPAENGCDSTVVLTLEVLTAPATAVAATICANQSYAFGGETLNESGVFEHVFTAENGCDSTVTLTLEVLPTISTQVNAFICSGISYSFDGQQLTASGVYTGTFLAENGCDSLVTLSLSVVDTLFSAYSASICAGETYTFGDQVLDESGEYFGTFSAAGGCDSLVFLTLTVLPVSTSDVEASICAGETYDFNGTALTENGLYTAVLTNAAGCDSTVHLTLTILPLSASETEASICAGTGYPFYGQLLSEAGTYTAVLTNAVGCDSTVTLTLTVLPVSSTAISASICAGTVYSFNGQDLTEAGTYTAVLQGSNGCDSTVTLALDVLVAAQSELQATTCAGSVYAFNGQQLTESGTYTAMLPGINGCDSLVILTLNVLPVAHTEFNDMVCAGTSYPFNGQPLTQSGTYTATLTAANGCDSVVTLHLEVLPAYQVHSEATICAGDTLEFSGLNLTAPGTYTVHLQTASGCDSTLILTLSVNTPNVSVTLQGTSLTAAATNATFQWIDCGSGQPVTGATGNTFTPEVSGLYAVQVTQNGCTALSACTQVTVVATGEAELAVSWQIAPNPAQGWVNLELKQIPASNPLMAELYDLTGRLCQRQSIPAGQTRIRLDLGNLPEGLYFIRLQDGHRATAPKRLVKTVD